MGKWAGKCYKVWSETVTSELRRKKQAGTTDMTGLAPSENLQKPARLGLHEEEGRHAESVAQGPGV